jgi:hypothetical protein
MLHHSTKKRWLAFTLTFVNLVRIALSSDKREGVAQVRYRAGHSV